mgnify:CR=1 FL=1
MFACSRIVMTTTFAALITTSVANAASEAPQTKHACDSQTELTELAQTIRIIAARPDALTRSAKSQLVGVFDGGWLIATALGDHGRASCFATLSDTLGLLPAQRMTGDDTVLEKVKMPPGLASHVHKTAMQIIRRL